MVARVARRRTLSAMRLARSFARVASLFSRRARSSATSDDAEAVISGSLSNRPDARAITVAWRLSSGPGKGARSTSPPEQGRGSVDGTIPAGRREKCAREVSEARSEARGAGRFRRPRRRKHRRAARAKRQSSSRHRAAAVFFIGGGGGGGALQSAAHVRRARSSTARRGIPEDPVERPLSPTT